MAFGKVAIVLLIAVHVCNALFQSVGESDDINWSLLPTTDCGQKASNRISNDSKTFPFEYPWMVLLRFSWNGQMLDIGGGSLINHRYVLTAAHSVRTQGNMKLSKVRLGEHDRSKDIDCVVYANGEKRCADPPLDVDVESTVVHSEYKRSSRFQHDIALIRMAQDVAYSDSIKPICLPIREDVRSKILPEYILTGWSVTEQRNPSRARLLQRVLKHMSIPESQQKLKENSIRSNVSEKYQMSTGNVFQVDSCGDFSGAPLGFSVDLVGDRFVQYGIASSGVNSCIQRLSTVPAIYTRVSSYMNWIVKNMKP
ncbi:CLIP-domain serine protease subfamily B [Anopheles darlingi]|uniref:CLIP-domain serine protease subfamily B n=1 Tax=Anopheles darlingi TaxID=43151 RepID=W5JSB2_ANODA|nr:CLIP-domain serine protease subfamily B [Anopheles darlingi]